MPRRKKSSHENQSRSSLSINKDKPQQRYAANARERARMRVLSRAFCRLKTTLPWVPADTKLSKLDTLRLAASYIAHLKGILRDETLGSSESSLHPAMSMTWPFGFNRPLGGSAGGEEGSMLGSEDDEDDDDEDLDDDVESISSCTWEEVSPPSSATKDCIHLDTRSSKGRARGKTTTATRQVHNKKEASSPSPNLNKHDVNPSDNINGKSENFPLNNNCTTTNPVAAAAVRPLSQTQHHHHQSHHHQHQQQEHLHNDEVMFHHFEPEIKHSNISSLNTSAMMAMTNSENAPPHLHTTAPPQNEILVGVGNPGGMGNNNDSFLAEIHGASFTQLSHHMNHGGNNDMHHHAPTSLPYGFGSSDLISIG